MAIIVAYPDVVGLVVRLRLAERELSREECAAETGVSKNTLIRLMAGGTRMDLEQLGAIALFLGWTPGQLLKAADVFCSFIKETKGVKTIYAPSTYTPSMDEIYLQGNSLRAVMVASPAFQEIVLG